MGRVVELPCWTSHRVEPDQIFDRAKGRFENVLVLGWDKDGEFVALSSESDMKEALWLATKFVHKLHKGDFG